MVAGWWWQVTRGPVQVVPDGAVDLLWVSGHPPFLAGPDTAPQVARFRCGLTVVGVRLATGVAAAVLGDDVHHATDRRVDLAALLPTPAATGLADRLEEAGASGAGPEAAAARVAAELAGWATARVEARGRQWRPDPLVADGVERLRRGEPLELHGLGERQFRRRFVGAVGYGPAFYRRIVRLDRATDLLARHPHRSLAEVAAEAGYSDESHLSRDAVALTGATPGRLRSA